MIGKPRQQAAVASRPTLPRSPDVVPEAPDRGERALHTAPALATRAIPMARLDAGRTLLHASSAPAAPARAAPTRGPVLVQGRAPQILQAKLKVSAPNDRFEQEADRVAAEVMEAPGTVRVQRKCAACSGDDPDETVQRVAAPTAVGQPSVDAIARPAGGASLPAAIRSFMEPRFGYDFGGVRVHADHHLAPRLQARAFTVGSNIFFAPGEFQPHTRSGQHIISHELTHTIQQGAVPALGSGVAEQSPVTAGITRTGPAIQREVSESEVASSSQVLSRIAARVSVADTHAAAIVQILRALNTAVPASATPPGLAALRTLISNEPLFRAGMVDLLRLIELGLEFNPGAGRDSPQNSFVYTCRCGWIDMGHFFISSAVAYVAGFLLRFVTGLRARLGGVNAAQASLIIGWFMEHLQEAFRQFVTGPFGALLSLAPEAVREAVMGNVRSAFTVEDLPSDALGAGIGQEVFDDWMSSAAAGAMGMDLSEPEPFDIRSRMTTFFSECGAVFPTGQTRRAMVEETVGTGPLPRQHFSTTPVLLTSALGLCPVAETACPQVDEHGWEAAHPAGMIDEASDRTTLWNFAVDVPALKAEHQQRLRQAAVAAPSNAMIMVEGFASCSGSAAHNERLARSRAETAANFLRAQRADLRVGMNYFGERTPRPPVTAGDGEAMARNRRVEIYVVDVARTRLGLPRFQLPTQVPLPTPTAAPPATTPPPGSP
jgi:outer membrane protein OmpA-like peptidoglycan-associated protein